MKEIDWSKAPEGATHYSCDDRHAPWLKVEAPDRAFWWDGQRWGRVLGFRMPLPAEYVPLHAAGPDIGPFSVSVAGERLDPLLPPWNGDGLPPVGAVCEVEDEDGNWHECRILAHHMEDAVFIPGPGYPYGAYDGLPDGRFRPFRTPDQIAAEEREKALKEEMAGIVFSACGAILADDVLSVLYDAGYRRQEPKE